MITMLWGYPGGGKSYYAVLNYIIPHMKGGKHVYSSLAGFDALRAAVIHGIDPNLYHPLDPKNLTPWLDVPEGSTQSLFVLDEVQNLYGSSNFKDHVKQREFLKQYLSMHRHRGDAVVAICQEPATVDKFFRDLTEHFVELRKLNAVFGANTKTFSAIHRKGGTSKSNKVISQETLTYKPEFYVCYQSTIPGAEETKTKSDSVRLNPLKILWPLFASFAFLVVAGAIYWHSKTKKPDSHTEPTQISKQNGVIGGSSGKPNSKIVADGWISDSVCVLWLSGTVEVAKSCPDYGDRSGLLPCSLLSGDSCLVEVRAREVLGSLDRGSEPKVEPPSDRPSSGSSEAPRSPLSPGPVR